MTTTNKKAKILVVDDEFLIAADLESRLTRLGYTVCGLAHSSQTALNLIELDQPDLVLLDIVLHGQTDGLGTAALIREKWGLPVVFITGYDAADHLESISLSYPYGYILKPIKDHELKIAIETALFVAQADAKSRQTEAALRDSEELFRTALGNTPDLALLYDPDLRIRYLNAAARRLAGRTESDLLGKREEEIWPAEFYQQYLPTIRHALASKETCSLDTDFNVPGLGWRRVSVTYVPLLDPQGEVREILVIAHDYTDRWEADNKRRHAEQRYRTLFEDAPAMYLTTRNRDGLPIIEDCNNLFLETLGYDRAQVVGRSLTDFYTAESTLELLEGGGYQRAMTGLCLDEERQLLAADGRRVRTFLRAMPETDAQGRVCGTRAMYMDITVLKQVEEALRESESRYRQLVELAPVGIAVYGHGKIVFANPAGVRMLGGVSEEVLIGKPMEEIVHPKRLTATMERLERMLAGQTGLYPTTDVYLNMDGTPIDVEVMAAPLTFRGNPAIQVIFTDITARKRSENELRKLSQALEQSPVSVEITDRHGNIEYVNAKFSAVTGYGLEEVIGKNPGLLKSGESPDEEYHRRWQTIASGQEWHGEIQNKRKDGSVFWERVSISPIRDHEGSITHFLGIKEDITTAKNMQAQLLQAQKMEAVGRLAGGVAHDYNNMLSVILGNAQMAASEIDPDHPIYESLQEVINAAQRSANLTRQLLGFARKQTVAPEILDLNETVSSMLKMLRRLIGENIELVWKPGADLWPVKMDPTQVDQILANLAVNSRDAITGSGTLTIETKNIVIDETYAAMHAGFRPGQYVRLAISDTGCGMDQETLAHVFEPFFTTKEKGRGTGLGLATTYGIVKQNNGFIDVDSEPNQGTSFKIHLPGMPVSTETAEQQEQQILVRGTETLLLVEDDEAVLKLGRVILERQGYQVVAAANPVDALALAETYPEPIHLLVTDVVMPLINGKELADKITGLRPGLKVLYISGYTADVIAHQGVVEAGLHFLQKPFSVATLSAKVREVLDT